MTKIASITAVTATSAHLNLTNVGADGTMDVQYSPRPDFSFCVAPTFNIPVTSQVDLYGLNQRTTYWIRVRNRNAAGAVEVWENVEAFRTLDADARVTTPAAIMVEPAMLVLPETPLQGESNNMVAGFPFDNMFRDGPMAFRAYEESDGAFAFYIRTAGQPIDTIALLNTNIPESASINVTGAETKEGTYNGQSQFVTAFEKARASANLPSRRGFHALHKLGQVRRSRWYRVALVNCQVPGKLIHIEHMVFGLNRASKNYANEKSETAAPLSTIDRKRSGLADRVSGRAMRKVEFELQMLTEAQYETLYAELWQRETDAALVVPNTKAGAFLHDRILFGDLMGGRTISPSSPRFNRSIAINSII